MYGATAGAQWSGRSAAGTMKLGTIPWLATGLAIAATVALIALVAFGVPDSLMTGLARMTGMTSLLPRTAVQVVRMQSSRWPQGPEALPEAVREPLAGSGVGRVQTLRERPPLLIETATIVVPPGGAGLRIVTPSLSMRDVTIITNGAPVEIETEALDVTNATIRAFATDSPDADGRDGGTVRILVHRAMRGLLTVDLSGQAGAPGKAGAPGQAGAPGAQGPAARSGPTECLAPAGRGGDGKAGGAGGAGDDGKAGGKGGTLDVAGRNPLGIASQVQFAASGGKGGAGGPGGSGGRGGPGGRGGLPAGVCFGDGPPGGDGPDGPRGAAGAAGRNGADGVLHIHDLDDA